MTSQGYPQEDLLDLLNSLDESLPAKNGVEATKLEIVPGKFVPPTGVVWPQNGSRDFGKKEQWRILALSCTKTESNKNKTHHAQKGHKTCQKCICIHVFVYLSLSFSTRT